VDDRIRRDVRFLKGYAMLSTVMMAVLFLGAFSDRREKLEVSEIRAQRAKFDVVDAERVNVIEPNGQLRLALTNGPRSQNPLYKGQPFLYTGRHRPGIIFFNDEGTENGGLLIIGKRDSLGKVDALGHFSLDQYNQDQVIAIQYVERNGKRRMGLQINDREETSIYDWSVRRDSLARLPDSPAKTEALRRLNAGTPDDPRVAERIYLGRDTTKTAVINLSDKWGKTRLRLAVDSLGAARVEFLDAQGRVTHRLSGAER
jgi:hypothetical protein